MYLHISSYFHIKPSSNPLQKKHPTQSFLTSDHLGAAVTNQPPSFVFLDDPTSPNQAKAFAVGDGLGRVSSCRTSFEWIFGWVCN